MAPEEKPSGFIMGGYLKDITKPLKREFPGPEKRKVTANIHCWAGAGGRHYYVSLKEEKNGFVCRCKGLDGKRGLHIHTTWDDKGSEGKYLHEKFDTKFEADAWIKKTFEKNFSLETHILMQDDGRPMLKWIYREGD